MFFKKRVEQKKNEMFEMIKTLLPTNATVVSFDYYKKKLHRHNSDAAFLLINLINVSF